ncbi:hypothetical protein SprV_0602200600 [Sparganum proliferum]
MDRELVRYKVDTVALSETRFSEQGQLEEVGAGYSFFWCGRPKAEQRNSGVAFAIRNDIVGRLLCLPQDINDRLMGLRLLILPHHLSFIVRIIARIFNLRSAPNSYPPLRIVYSLETVNGLTYPD